jgi:hypothetical protein
MKQLVMAVCFILLCPALSAWAGSPQADLSGTWIQNPEQSDARPQQIRNLGAPGNVAGGGFGGGMGGGGFGGGRGGPPPGGGMGSPPPGGGMQTPPPAAPPPMVIKQTGKDIQISTTVNMYGKEVPTVENYALDGKEIVEMVPMPNSPEKSKRKTKAQLKKNKLTITVKTSSSFMMDGSKSLMQNDVKKEYELSEDGKTLTLKVSTNMVMNSMPTSQTVQKFVYNRQ